LTAARYNQGLHVAAIIAGGGRGQRFGGGELKQLLSIGGRAILDRSVTAFLTHPAIAEVVVALPQELVDAPPEYLRGASKPLRIVAGGVRRQDSVANAFHAAAATSDVIVIHDAARPFASADLIARTIAAAEESGAAVAAVVARDTVKQAELVVRHAHHERDHTTLIPSSSPFDPARGDPDPSTGSGSPRAASRGEAGEGSTDERAWVVTSTLPRDTIFLAQTPQAFRRDVLQKALAYGAREGIDATDEAALAERAGHPVRIVEGEATNIKITTPHDIAIAEAIAEILRNADRGLRKNGIVSLPESQSATRNPQSAMTCVGTGYDLHRLVEGRPLVVGGVTIASPRGALGHSDADVACHAITDAVLGAACLGDIGRHFPDSDPRWKDASSLDLLARAAAAVREAGYEVNNVDVTVILEAPKILEHIAAMRRALSKTIGIDEAAISVKGKTNEGVDAVGRGEAIAAHAVALLHRRIPNP
jgi:2-C-methyl-D-erythritol 4-phosphate cytidylyltransferase/2-C-methyl-D-erythritol 2,4-cyclodiphosphate synthase